MKKRLKKWLREWLGVEEDGTLLLQEIITLLDERVKERKVFDDKLIAAVGLQADVHAMLRTRVDGLSFKIDRDHDRLSFMFEHSDLLKGAHSRWVRHQIELEAAKVAR